MIAMLLGIILISLLLYEGTRPISELVVYPHTVIGWDHENLIVRYFGRTDESWIFVPTSWYSFEYSKDTVIPGCWYTKGFPHLYYFYTSDGYRYLIRSGSRLEVISNRDLW